MSLEEVHRIRDRSEGWKAYVAKKIKSTPWHSDEGEMIKKTVIKRAYKLWPKTDRLDGAVHFLNTENGEGLEVVAQQNTPAPVHSAKDAMREEYDALPVDRRQIVDAVVEAILGHYEKDDIHGAYEEYTGLDENTTERFACWYFLPSHVRTALTKHKKQVETAKPVEG